MTKLSCINKLLSSNKLATLTVCSLLFVNKANAESCQTYSYSGSPENYTVPAGVTRAKFTVIGADGGDSKDKGRKFKGGSGASITGEYQVNSGDIFLSVVGQVGNTADYEAGGGGGSGLFLNGATVAVAGAGGGGDNTGAGHGGQGTPNGSAGTGTPASAGGAGGTGGNGGVYGLDYLTRPGTGGGGGLTSPGGTSIRPGSSTGGGACLLAPLGNPIGGAGGFDFEQSGQSNGGWGCGGGGAGANRESGGGGGYSGGGGAGGNGSAGAGGSFADGSVIGGSIASGADGAGTEKNGVIKICFPTDVSVNKVIDTAGPFTVGQTIDFNITVSNNGLNEATNIVVTDTYANLTINSVAPNDPRNACNALPCTIADLPKSESTTIKVSATITAAGAFENTANIIADEDSEPTNNKSTASGNAVVGGGPSTGGGNPPTGSGSPSTGGGTPAPVIIDAHNDTETVITDVTVTDVAGGTSVSVLINDTIGGKPVTLNDVILTPGQAPNPAQGSITMNPDGTVTVAPGTTPGTYEYPYTICEKANPNNCDSAVMGITVEATLLLPYIEANLDNTITDDIAVTLINQGDSMNGYANDVLSRFGTAQKQETVKQTKTKSMKTCLAEVNERLKQNKILFDTDKAIIKQQSYSIIDEIVSMLRGCDGSKFEITGHTDSDASDVYNLALSQRRVQAVKLALAERGYNTDGVVARGYGESMPIASNTTREGKAQNRRVEFIPLNTAEEMYKKVKVEGPVVTNVVDCSKSKTDPKVYAKGDDDTLKVKGAMKSEMYDCNSGTWNIVEGSVNYYDNENDNVNAQVNLSYRREGFSDDNTLTGWFVGAYGKKSDIDGQATGTVSGYGVNAGVYRADKFANGLAVDGYAGAALGKHNYDAEQDTSIGTIQSQSDYNYVAGFLGAAVSGEVKVGESTNVTPRIGLDYAYTPGSDVNVDMQLNTIKQSGSMSVDALSGGRAFAEIRGEQLFNDGNSAFALTPRISCYQTMGNDLNEQCGVGGSVELSTENPDSNYSYSIKLDAEKGENYHRASITGSIKKEVTDGVYIKGDTSADSKGDYSVGVGLDIKM